MNRLKYFFITIFLAILETYFAYIMKNGGRTRVVPHKFVKTDTESQRH